MEKLIDLLNEWYQERYETNTRFDKFKNYGGNDYGYFLSNDNGHFMYETDVWTKKYGFIKRLVEKDKIDREKFGNSETKSSKYSDFELSYDTPREDYTNTLLMELAIQDEPIDFLTSILK